jgi:hypothetical protein
MGHLPVTCYRACPGHGSVSETRTALLDRLAATLATLHPDRRIRASVDDFHYPRTAGEACHRSKQGQ